jgi:hypothetical protein
MDPPRTKTSAVRIGGASPTSSMPRMTQTPQVPRVPRRQLAGASQLPGHATRKIASPPDVSSPKPSLFIQLKQMHWLFLIGFGMIVALILWLAGSAVLAWGTQRYYDVRYGNPRTFHIDQAVGHGGDSPAHPSHFMAMNLNNRAIVIEFKAGDPARINSYDALIMINDNGQSLVTVSFKDVNGDKKLDMIIDIHLPGQEQYAIFINDKDKDEFRPAKSSDIIHL